jgi:hypothetical protein
MSKTASGTWKNAERRPAAAWTDATGKLCKRNILSGSNNRGDDGKARPGDIVFHSDLKLSLLAECKLRAKHMLHALFKAAEADAKKHGILHTILYTFQKGDHGYLVTMDEALFHKMLSVPGILDLLRK